ncbi:hypothetical protein MMC07_004118 [Pseudocyphellaria aurata]|nr:hypothetical protein [Pseudocyphellaria aurata]
MPVSKTVIPSNDEETIRRFTQEIRRRSTSSLPSLQGQVEQFAVTMTQRNSNSPYSNGEDRATQTDPVTITAVHGAVPARNGDTMKRGSVLDSVLLQSPPGSGVLAPPTTPETHPSFSELDISQLIVENIENLPASSIYTLQQSRHAAPFAGNLYQPNMQRSSTSDYVSSSMARGQLSQADEIVRNQSFARLSFQAADSPAITARGSSPASLPSSARFSPNVVKSNATAGSPGIPSTVSTRGRSAGVAAWNLFASGASEPKPFADSANRSSANSSSANRSVSQGTTALAVSDNEQAISPLKEDSAKPPMPKENWVPPHLRTPDYALKDPNFIKPNRSYLGRAISGGESAKKHIDYLQWSAAGLTIPAQAATSSDPGSTPALVATSGDPGSSETILTPSSVIFRAVSPPTPTEGSNEARENQIYFSAWGKPEQRKKPAAKIRKVILGVSSPTASLVASLVWGGIIEEIQVKSSSADVLFADGDDCQTYFEATAGGIKYTRDGRDTVVSVEKGRDVDVISGRLDTYLQRGFTRCVRAVDVLETFTLADLWTKAKLKNRKVEGIQVAKNEAGLRYVVFRFCSIAHAVSFKQGIVRDEEWEHCNIHYVADPCARATGVHFDN